MTARAPRMRGLVTWLLRGVVIGYRYSLAYFLGGRCRFQPSCSEYALEALDRHGPWRGGMLAIRRILRCHPWGGSGHDPVPGPGSNR